MITHLTKLHWDEAIAEGGSNWLATVTGKQEGDAPRREQCDPTLDRVIMGVNEAEKKTRRANYERHSAEGGSSRSCVLLNVNSHAIMYHLGTCWSNSLLLHMFAGAADSASLAFLSFNMSKSLMTQKEIILQFETTKQ